MVRFQAEVGDGNMEIKDSSTLRITDSWNISAGPQPASSLEICRDPL